MHTQTFISLLLSSLCFIGLLYLIFRDNIKTKEIKNIVKTFSNNQSPDHIHYDKITSFLKWLFSLLAIMTAFAVWMIGESVADIKKDMRDELINLQSQLNNLTGQSNDYLSSLKTDSKNYLDDSRQIASLQLSAIKEEVKYLALESAKNEIIETFKKNNMEELVKKIADEKLKGEIEILISTEINNVASILDILPDLSIAYEQIGYGNFSYFKFLDSISTFHPNQKIREIAYKFLIQKGEDFDNNIWIEEDYRHSESSRIRVLRHYKIELTDLSTEEKKTSLINKQVQNILTYHENDLGNLSEYFLIIKLILNDYSLKTFDMNKIREMNLKYKKDH